MKYFLCIALIFSSLTVFAQVGLHPARPFATAEIPSFTPQILPFFTPAPVAAPFVKAAPASAPAFLYRSYRYEDLAFFCKVEVQLENAARFPVKFRLGSVEYVDRLEGK